MRLFLSLETVVVGAALGLLVATMQGWDAAATWAVSLAGVVALWLLLRIPILAPVVGVALSLFWGVLAFALASSAGTLVAVLVGAVVAAGLIVAHLQFRRA